MNIALMIKVEDMKNVLTLGPIYTVLWMPHMHMQLWTCIPGKPAGLDAMNLFPICMCMFRLSAPHLGRLEGKFT